MCPAQTIGDETVTRFLRDLSHHLARLSDRLFELMREAPFERAEINDSDQPVDVLTRLVPDDEQRRSLHQLFADFTAWIELAGAFIKRYSETAQDNLSELEETLASYFLLERVGTDISEQTWKETFEREASSLLATLLTLLNGSQGAFSILRDRHDTQYDDFTLEIGSEAESSLAVQAAAPGSVAREIVQLPFSERDLEIFLLKHCLPRGRTRAWTPRAIRPLIEFGTTLFNSVFSQSIRNIFEFARSRASSEGRGLRIRVNLTNAPVLAGMVPWELLYDGIDFLCLSQRTPIVRHFNQDLALDALAVSAPLRLLVTASVPRQLSGIDAEREKQRILTALGPFQLLGLLQVDVCPDGRLKSLQRLLREAEVERRPYHIWHFIGHGMYDEYDDTSFLLLEGDHGEEQRVSGFELGTLFNNTHSLRLVVMNACEGARGARHEPLSGVAGALVERGTQAVVAMQFEISDSAAITIAEELYGALMDGSSVESAVTEARRALFFLPNYVEWSTPVVFLRSGHGGIFDLRRVLRSITAEDVLSKRKAKGTT